MIGKKISDQTITCKVIKPMQLVVNSNSNLNIVKGQSPSKQSSKFMNMNFDSTQHNQGRVFGINDKQVQVEVDIGFGYENEFNRLNHYEQHKYIEKTGKDINKNDFSNGNSRNVTHFFINHKEKPINIEVVKKTTQTNKNNINLIGPSDIKKNNQTSKVQDANMKAKKDDKLGEKDKKPANTINSNRGAVIDQKFISNKSSLLEKNTTKTSNFTNQQKSTSKYTTKTNKEKLTNQPSNKDIKQCIQNKQNIQTSNQQSFVHNNKSFISFKKSENSVQKVSRKQIKIMEQVSLQHWQEISQEPSLCIENYKPQDPNQILGKYHTKRQTNVQKKQKTEQIKQKPQPKPINPPSKLPVPQKPNTITSKPAQKRYMSVKEEIQEKLKERKLKQQQLEMKKREIQEQRKMQEKQQQIQDEQKEDDNCSQQEEEEEQRAQIPEPIILAEQKESTEPVKIQQQVKTQPVKIQQQVKAQSCQILQLDDVDRLNNSQLIYNQIMADFNQHQAFQIVASQLKYNYIQSSDQDNDQAKFQTVEGQELEGESQMVKFKDFHESQMTDQMDKFQKFEEDLQQELSFRHHHQSEMQQAQQNAELFQDQQILEAIKYGEVKNLNSKEQLKVNQHSQKQAHSKQVNLKKPIYPSNITKSQTLPKQIPSKQQYQQQQSDQQQEQQSNPKLLQYLKQRNLLPSNKSNHTLNKQKDLSYHSTNRLKINQILNSHHLALNDHQREVIVELDQEYLQSSIIVSSRKKNNNGQGDNDNQREDGGTKARDVLKHDMRLMEYQSINQLNICDSSDSQQDSRQHLSIPTPFVKIQNSSSFDQLFDLNLQSLLKKQFIQLQ